MNNKYRYKQSNTKGMWFVEEYQKSMTWKTIQVLYSEGKCRKFIKELIND